MYILTIIYMYYDRDKTVKMSVEELQSKWIDLCIETSRPYDMSSFSIGAALPLIYSEDVHVELVNKTLDAINSLTSTNGQDDIYITQQELIRLWNEASLLPMGKQIGSFTIQEALLLLDLEEDMAILSGSDMMDVGEGSKSSQLEMKRASDAEPELYITAAVCKPCKIYFYMCLMWDMLVCI
jgi:hypothetical protein